MTVAPINHARDRAIQAALRAHIHLTRCQDAEALTELNEAMAFAVAVNQSSSSAPLSSQADASKPGAGSFPASGSHSQVLQ